MEKIRQLNFDVSNDLLTHKKYCSFPAHPGINHQ